MEVYRLADPAGPFALPYRWRPMSWKVDCAEYLHERAISTQPVVKPIKITAPNSVFALGTAFSK